MPSGVPHSLYGTFRGREETAAPAVAWVLGRGGSDTRMGGRVMGEDEDRCVERRVGTPRALPLRVLVPPGVAELPGTHDLGADPRIVPLDEGVVDAAATAGLPPPGRKHPLVQPIPGVAEMCVVALTLAGAEPVQ